MIQTTKLIDRNHILKNCVQCVREKDDHAINSLTTPMILTTITITILMTPIMTRMATRLTFCPVQWVKWIWDGIRCSSMNCNFSSRLSCNEIKNNRIFLSKFLKFSRRLMHSLKSALHGFFQWQICKSFRKKSHQCMFSRFCKAYTLVSVSYYRTLFTKIIFLQRYLSIYR